MHANMEATGLPDASFDMVAVQFVTHECPAHAIQALVRPRPSPAPGPRWPDDLLAV
jgi:hypothetical protein